ncbi:T9SS type A sorting domain-containing protein [bacterium]|nr:T9SS type A sorting domain-containing protein [bacterium]
MTGPDTTGEYMAPVVKLHRWSEYGAVRETMDLDDYSIEIARAEYHQPSETLWVASYVPDRLYFIDNFGNPPQYSKELDTHRYTWSFYQNPGELLVNDGGRYSEDTLSSYIRESCVPELFGYTTYETCMGHSRYEVIEWQTTYNDPPDTVVISLADYGTLTRTVLGRYPLDMPFRMKPILGYSSNELYLTTKYVSSNPSSAGLLYYSADSGSSWQFQGDLPPAGIGVPFPISDMLSGWGPGQLILHFWSVYRPLIDVVYISFDYGVTWQLFDGNVSNVPDDRTGQPQEITIQVWPNPTNGRVTIQTSHTNQPIHVFNLLGRKVLSFPATNDRTQTFNMSGLNSGVYLLTVGGGEATRLVLVK